VVKERRGQRRKKIGKKLSVKTSRPLKKGTLSQGRVVNGRGETAWKRPKLETKAENEDEVLDKKKRTPKTDLVGGGSGSQNPEKSPVLKSMRCCFAMKVMRVRGWAGRGASKRTQKFGEKREKGDCLTG